MKRSTKLLTAASLLSGVLAGILLAPAKGKESRRKLAAILQQPFAHRNKEQLLAAKQQLEQHRNRVDQHLRNIETRLQALEDKG